MLIGPLFWNLCLNWLKSSHGKVITLQKDAKWLQIDTKNVYKDMQSPSKNIQNDHRDSKHLQCHRMIQITTKTLQNRHKMPSRTCKIISLKIPHWYTYRETTWCKITTKWFKVGRKYSNHTKNNITTRKLKTTNRDVKCLCEVQIKKITSYVLSHVTSSVQYYAYKTFCQPCCKSELIYDKSDKPKPTVGCHSGQLFFCKLNYWYELDPYSSV